MFGERLRTIGSTGYQDDGERPSMESLHSMKSTSDLGDGERPSMERLHSIQRVIKVNELPFQLVAI